jgi:hypothetical protein
VPAPIVAVLDANGYVSLNGVQSVTVLATNSTYYNPNGWTYRVSFDNLAANGRRVTFDPYNIEVPVGSTVDLSSVTPITGSTGTPIVRGPKGDTGATGPQGIQGIPGNNVPTDTAVAGYLATPTSSSTAAAANVTATPQGATLYVDSTNGVDSASSFWGGAWIRAYKTIQAAVNALPTNGGEVVLSPGDHNVGSGVVWDRTKLGTLRGPAPLNRRQHADGTYRQARLTSTATTKPSSYIKVPAASTAGANAYGGTFQDFYIDGDSLAAGGAGIELHAVNRTVFSGIGGRSLNNVGSTMLVKSDSLNGDDASWFTFRDCFTYGMLGVNLDNSNYLDMDASNSFMGITGGGAPAGPAVYVRGTQPQIAAHLEGWATAIQLNGCRGALISPSSEWCGTLVQMDACYDSIVSSNSSAGAGNSEVVDNGGTNNTVIGARHRKTGLVNRAMSLSSFGVSPAQMAYKSINLIHGPNPGLPTAGPAMPADGYEMMDLFVSGSGGSTVQYWDGSAWQTWSVSLAPTMANNEDVLTVDATHKRFRIRTGGLLGASTGLVYCRFDQGQGGNNGSITVRELNSDLSVRDTQTIPYSLPNSVASPGNLLGFQATVGNYATNVEVEFNLDLTGSQTAALKRLALFTTEMHANLRGRFLRAVATPEGVLTGRLGDMCQVSSFDTTAGLYIKMTDSGNTGWKKVTTAT